MTQLLDVRIGRSVRVRCQAAFELSEGGDAGLTLPDGCAVLSVYSFGQDVHVALSPEQRAQLADAARPPSPPAAPAASVARVEALSGTVGELLRIVEGQAQRIENIERELLRLRARR